MTTPTPTPAPAPNGTTATRPRDDRAGYQAELKKLSELIKDIRFAMLTTTAPDGSLRSRPMATQQVEFDGDLWFFAGRDSEKATDIVRSPAVNVAFADERDNRYVSLAGNARLVEDAARAKALWSPLYQAWFPEGLDDPNLALLKVEVTGAEYWDAPSNKMVLLLGMAKAVATGKEYEGGENREVDLRSEAAGRSERVTR
jgi:general stress protein 26